MKKLLLTSLIIISPVVYGSGIPNMVCQEITSETLLFGPLNSLGQKKVMSLYKFTDNKLYLSSSIREEYFYNNVSELEPGRRYQAGYKTIVSLDNNFKKVAVSHHDHLMIEISELQCTKI